MKNRNRDAACWAWGRLVEPPATGGYLVLQWPVTRSPAMSVQDSKTFYTLLRAICEGITATYAKEAGREFSPDQIARRLEWHKAHPPAGFEVPGWRLQWPLRRVRANQVPYTFGDLARQEGALWAGAKAGMDVPEPPWAEAFELHRETLLAGYRAEVAAVAAAETAQ